MNRKVLAFLAFLSLALISLGAPAQPNGYIHVVSHLERFQTATGGFSLVEGGKPSLEATSHALFLSSLFGLRAKINQQEVARFIQTLENGDYGYGKSAGSPSDLESVRHAVLSYQHLGLAVPNAGNVASYIKSLYDAQTNLFASRAGEKGDLKSTALAFQALEYLGELQRQWVQDIFEKVRVYLSKHVQLAENAHFAFDEKTLTTTSANYYGVVLGSYVGFDFVSLPKWAAFVAQLQNAEGGFATGLDRRTATVESTLHAVSTLRLLQQTKGNDDQFVTLVKSDALVNYLLNIPRDLRSAAQAHLAVAFTNAFSRNFETRVFYELLRATGSAEKKVVQGTQLKPVVSVKTFDGFAHPGLDIEATITFEDARDALKTKLQLKDGEHYASNDFFDTTNHLGGLRIHYTVRCYVVGVGELSFELEDNKKIGYGVAVDARATLAVTGQQFAQGETVAVGTDFTFGVALHNQTQKDLQSGDFSVVFSVLDSSLVPIHVERVDGQTNAKPLNFHYTLKSTNLPSGDLVFRFEVISDAGVVHTTEYVSYQLSVPMIATHIAFEGVAEGAAPTYKIGDTVRVSIEPASFPDLRAVAAYPLKDVTGNDTAPQRRFVMDVHSRKGALLRTVAGKAQTTEASAKYVFEVPITATLDSIGVNVISFRYIPSSGRSVDVASYDSRLGEVIEDTASLNYTVNANLQVVDVKEQPEGTTFAYGQVVPFRFRVQDSLSGLYVSKGDNDQANVYLNLKHADEAKGKPFVSAFEAANEVISATGDKEFVIQWAINPNAVQGNGVLSLVVQDADGNVIDIFDAKTKKPLSLDVTVGGDIQVEHSSYSTSDAATFRETAFVVQVGLTCQNQTLKNAQLRASVFRDDQLVASFLPVAVNDSGVYSVSWGGRHEAFPSGVYTVKFYREVDRKRAVDAHEFQEKRKKREEQLKQIEEGSEAAPAEEVAEELVVENIVTPLFEVSHSHSAPSTSKLPIRAEVLLAFLLGGAFMAISYQKKHYLAAK